MGVRVSELVLDCRDPERLAAFWCEVLDFEILDREGDAIEIGPPEGFGGLQPTIILSPSADPDAAKAACTSTSAPSGAPGRPRWSAS